MKTITYSCDLCKEIKPRLELHQLYWGTKVYELLPPDKTDCCDKHICKQCIAIIKES